MASALSSSIRFRRCVVGVEVGGEFGTAFLIELSGRSGLFLTAYHVVSSAVRRKFAIRLRRGKGRGFLAKIVDINPARDLALLSAQLPERVSFRSAAIALVQDVDRLTVFQMFDPDSGIVAPLPVAIPYVGETAVRLKVGAKPTVIDRVWSQQGLEIPGGTSGAPVVSEKDDAIVAVACAGADELGHAFFVPLISAQTASSKGQGRTIATTLAVAQDSATRLGSRPNRRGVSLRCWMQTRASVRSLAASGVYEREHAIDRVPMSSAIKQFLLSDKFVALLAGESGVGKSTGVARFARRTRLDRPVLLLRAAQIALKENALETALSDALKLATTADLGKLPPMSQPAPLIIIDGINELPIGREDWSFFVRVQLSDFLDMATRQGWKVLLTTRRDRLEDMTDLNSTGKLYDPASEPGHSRDKKVGAVPCLRLASFDRNEFERLLKAYQLPASLPFAELRHPIVFRLLAEASSKGDAASVRVRNLFSQHLSELLRRIHMRCKDRSPDRIRELIQVLASINSGTTPGYVAHESLGDPRDEAVAEAAVAEGLFERVPGGYRYIYDEVFDYVQARTLVDDLNRRILRSDGSALQLFRSTLDGGATYGSLARALELLLDEFPATCRQVAEALASELDAVQLAASTPADLFTLLGITTVLSRVEKGGPLDQAKDQLPILRVVGSENRSVWTVYSPFPFAVSEDHISYAFDEERIWRMIRLAASTATLKKDDSYPFRSKDITNDLAHEDAKQSLEEIDLLKVVRHFVTGFPQQAFDRLSEGLAEEEFIGEQHTFGSFCGQVLAVYSDLFDLLKLMALDPHTDFFPLFERVAKKNGEKIVEAFLDERAGLTKNPRKAARCLTILVRVFAERPGMVQRLAAIATEMILKHEHPANLYTAVMPELATGPHRSEIAAIVEDAWRSGSANAFQLTDCVRAGLLSFEQSVALCVDRLQNAGSEGSEIMWDFVYSINGYFLRGLDDVDTQRAAIDEIVEKLVDPERFDSKSCLRATESLLWTAFKARGVSAPLVDLIAVLCREAPEAAINTLQYPLRSSYFASISGIEQQKICDALVSNLPESVAAYIVIQFAETSPNGAITKYIAAQYTEKFGCDCLFTKARTFMDNHRMMSIAPTRQLSAVLELLKEIDPERFERERQHFAFPEDLEDHNRNQ
jgi:hypothetical protein